MSEDSDAEVGEALQSQSKIRVCPECGGPKLMRDYEAAEIVCMACGFVIDEKLADTRPEWRAFDDEQKSKRARVGAPLTYTIHDKGLSTVIDWRDRRALGKRATATQRLDLYKLRKWQSRVLRIGRHGKKSRGCIGRT